MTNPSYSGLRSLAVGLLLALSVGSSISQAQQLDNTIPDILKPWKDWVIRNDVPLNCPRKYDNYGDICPVWPSQLNLQVTSTGATFQLQVDVRIQSWVGLPGDYRVWPSAVMVDSKPVPILFRNAPAVLLEVGKHTVTGSMAWKALPDSLQVGPSVGILALTLNGQPVEFPTWREDGVLLFQRPPAPPSERDYLEVRALTVIKDGLPLMMESHVELNVSGHNREEQLGAVIPTGWKLSSVNSPIPCSVDEQGKMKVQVRSGHWLINVSAFRLDPNAAIEFDPGLKPISPKLTVAFINNPSFRIANVVDIPAIDIVQTSFFNSPDWNGQFEDRDLRSIPAYSWTTDKPFHLLETMRGMGQKNRPGLTVVRHIFLNEDGKGLLDQDEISAESQERWRLDASPGLDLQGVKPSSSSNDPALLITTNPFTGLSGVELRRSQISIVASGMIQKTGTFPSSGWAAEVDSLKGELHLPPGWRVLALTGPDSVEGDWLTTWDLQDVFVLLIFVLTIGRFWGIRAGLIALVGYGLSFQEPDAPRLLWLFLLPPLVLLKFVKHRSARDVLLVWKWTIMIPVVACTANFLIEQINGAVYPQIENQQGYFNIPLELPNLVFGQNVTSVFSAINSQLEVAQIGGPNTYSSITAPNNGNGFYQQQTPLIVPKAASNLDQDDKAKIQTGPAIPAMAQRIVDFSWSSPVAPDATVQLYLITPLEQRLIDLVRLVLILVLGYWLLIGKPIPWGNLSGFVRVNRLNPAVGKAALVAMFLMACLVPSNADQPTDQQLTDLRAQLLAAPPAFPNAAEIESASLSIHGKTVSVTMEVDAAAGCAIPLPGKLPAWSPVSVKVDGQSEVSMNRADGYLWILIPEGIHTVEFDGFLSGSPEWPWTFKLKPHHLTVDAPDWTWSGVHDDGTLEDQVFFSQKEVTRAQTNSDYGRQHENTLVQVERSIEFGHVWRVTTTIRRLSKNTAGTWIHLPLIPGEHPFGDFQAKNGFIDVSLDDGQNDRSWVSELDHNNYIQLTTRKDDTWVEKWSLTASPIWNVEADGIEPTFNDADPTLTPVWLPWPGESVKIATSQPVAVPGNTLTLTSVDFDGHPGLREFTGTLQVSLECTVGQNFYVQLPADCKVTSLQLDGLPYPVQFDSIQSDRLVIALHPTSTQIAVNWKTSVPLGFVSSLPPIHFFHSDDEKIEPVVCYNTKLNLTLPDSSFVIGTWGPLVGPALTLWTWLVVLLAVSFLITRIPLFPIGTAPCFLLIVGLSQVGISMAVIPLAWLLLMAWRGHSSYQENSLIRKNPGLHNLVQVVLIFGTLLFLQSCFSMINSGLLGSCTLWIAGNQSDNTNLHWFQAAAEATPEAGCLALSVWWYKIAMVIWTLWLVRMALIWLLWGFKQITKGKFWEQIEAITD